MSWERKAGGGVLVKLGDKDGQQKTFEGVFLDTRPGDYGKPLYDFEIEGGGVATVPHNSDLDRIDVEKDKGKLIRIEFTGWASTRKGNTVKKLNIATWDSEPTAEMQRKYPSLRAGEPVAEPTTEPGDAQEDAKDDALPF